MSGHGIIKCDKCGTIIAQCRCIDHDQSITYQTCIKCKSVQYRKGIEFKTAIPTEAGYAVAMCEYKGHIFLACQYCVYQLSQSDDVFRKIRFEEVENEKS